ncbi:DUF2262 domain-containing protein [Bacillus sp. 165]|uniref:DUF2262 domain-containing protein n=1 Tax=Bacillus sp. 165 TaxID=1529117 RepID=UPI001ADCC3BC|nr:DUF2262 domain-containing protein [Bacillus sp. 165]MBO9128517.1 DUF2262 domain-containing protein [Bacillus sp. 165]
MNNESFFHPIFGQVKWYTDRTEWAGIMQLPNGKVIEVAINAAREDKQMDIHSRSCIQLMQHTHTLFETLADDLIETHNETWNEGESITKEEFIKKLSLEMVAFYNDGTSDLYFDDGDMFWGHIIIASVDSNGLYEEAQISG